jgi:hypothetical protein
MNRCTAGYLPLPDPQTNAWMLTVVHTAGRAHHVGALY